MRAVAADALDGEVLNGAQQLGLGRRRQIGDFVQKQRAAIGSLELPSPSADAGRDAILDAEQLGFEQRFDQRRAVDRDERAVAAATQLVDLPRDELFADAALAFEQHREIRGRHALDRGPAAPSWPASTR